MTPEDFEVNPEALRLAMRRWATGVTVVTSEHQGNRHGMTVSSFTSVSLAPPLVLVSLENVTRTCKLVKESKVFAVTILGAHQQAISDRFAGREEPPGEEADRFDGLKTYRLFTGAPLLVDGLSGFDCRVVAAYTAGTHTLFIGQVLAVRILGEEDPEPLVYFNRGYRWLNS